MRKEQLRERRAEKRDRRVVGTFDQLEERSLLTPIPLSGTTFQLAGGTFGQFQSNGFLSVRLISTQTGRIEVDPTGAFGNDVFVISRGTISGTGGLLPPNVNPGDAAGNIYRLDPYAIDGFGTSSPATNRILFGSIPGGGVSFGGYENWYDLAFDPTGSFTGVNDGPTLYVSTLDSTTTPGINPRNAIYAFQPDGSLATPPAVDNPVQVALFSARDVIHPGLLDSQLGALAVAPGDTFGRDLYVFDVACDNETGVTCAAGDGNTLFRVVPADVTAALLSNPAQDPLNPLDDFLRSAVDLDSLPSTRKNPHVENTLPALTPTPPNNDIDPRAMVFDPNRGIVLGGRNGEPAVPLYGGLFVASSDIEIPVGGTGDTGVTRFLHFPSLGPTTPIDMIQPPIPISTRMVGDMTIDPIGHFGGGLFFTDYISRSVFQIIQNPSTGLGTIVGPIISNFNVLTPTQFLPTDPPGITPADAYRDAFSISFSPDGEILFVSDRDGVWAFYAGTLAHSAAGTAAGVTDLRELHVPYTGRGFASAVLDSGVDSANLGFRNTVTAGFNPAFPSTGAFDTCAGGAAGDCHGTAVAGIIHQIVPDTVIVPVNSLGFITSFGPGGAQKDWEALTFVADHPFADDPRTTVDESVDDPATPQDERVRIVSVNMSFAETIDRFGTEREAAASAFSIVIPFKNVFQRFLSLGIVPVAAAGNEFTVNGSTAPAILNEAVEVIASYPYGITPTVPAPPITVSGAAATQTRCALEGGDEIAFPGKIVAFSNRTQKSDFAAPGTCIPTFTSSLFFNAATPAVQATTMSPLLPDFNGTSGASPFVAAGFVFGYDVLSLWQAVALAGGSISPTDSAATTADDEMAALNRYLTRDLLGPTDMQLPPSTISVGAAAAHLASYLNQDGINSILQWSAIPREDVNIGESSPDLDGIDDNVVQRRLLRSARYRTYAHMHLGNFLTSVEGSIALNYFAGSSSEFAQLVAAAGTPGLITAADIDAYVDDTTNSPTDRAIARLLGGSDRIARLNRVAYLDLIQDERVDGGIRADAASIAALRSRILPRATDFVITNRHGAALRTFALDSTAARNYHDLRYVPRRSSLAPAVPRRFRNASPDQLLTGNRGGFRLRSFTASIAETTPVTVTSVDEQQSAARHRPRHIDLVDDVLAGFLDGNFWRERGV